MKVVGLFTRPHAAALYRSPRWVGDGGGSGPALGHERETLHSKHVPL